MHRHFLLQATLGALVVAVFWGCSRSALKVDSAAEGAAVFMNDSAVGLTPWLGYVPQGPVHMVVEKNGDVLRDTVFEAGNSGQIRVGLLQLGSIAMLATGILLESVWPGLIGWGMAMVAIRPSVRLDHMLKTPASGRTSSDPLLMKPMPHGETLQYIRGRSHLYDTLLRTDSLCYESGRQTLWIHDMAKNTRRPLDTRAVMHCLPDAREYRQRNSALPFLVGGAAAGTLLMGGVGVSAGGGFFIDALPWGAAIGGAGGIWLWSLTSRHQRCDAHQDSLAFQNWLQQNPCSTLRAPAPLDAPETLPSGIHVIRLPDTSNISSLPAEAFPSESREAESSPHSTGAP